MSRAYSYLNSAKTILSFYKGELPFSIFLKSFFAKDKKFGSRDRRTIASICYNYFRTGAADKTYEEKLLAGIFLCNQEPIELLQEMKPDWNEKITLPLQDKLTLASIDVQTLFPFNNDLSDGIHAVSFNTSFLIQPDVFIRVRPGKLSIVKQKLQAAQIDFKQVNETCISLHNGSKLQEVLAIDRDAVIQDLNSQRVGALLQIPEVLNGTSVWDCCAASGGKSIMTHDLLPGIQLTVSDVRQSILHNLRQRFAEAQIKDYCAFVADLTNPKDLQRIVNDLTFDLIICDAPCSGSGTWSRTPEQLLYFKHEKINRYSNLQKSIVANTIPYLKKGGYFLYITCSVFRQENEEVVAFIKQQTNLNLVKMELLKGYNLKADTMFAALFRK